MSKKRLAKKLFSLLLAGAMLLPGTAHAAFSDVSGHWAESAIEKWSEQYGIIQGYDDGTFHPDASITRGAFAGILNRFLKYIGTAPEDTFSDTQGTYWEAAILKLNAAGVYLGNQGKALTDSSITRQQAVAMIARSFGITASESAPSYADADEIAEYAVGYVAAMEAKGYLKQNDNTSFRPTDPITRAEIVNILNNMVTKLYQTSGTYSEDVAGTAMINAEDGAALQDMTISGDLILAPGVQGAVSLTNVTVKGTIRNYSSVTPTVVKKTTDTGSDTGSTYLTYSGKKILIDPSLPVNPLKDGDFYKDENGWAYYTGSDYTTQLGVDVSAYQNRNNTTDKTIDWTAVKASGVDFALVRLGLRGYTSGTIMEDGFYAQNVDGAVAAGLETGVYFFSQAITVDEAVEEADYVIEKLQGHQISGPVAFDWEMSDSTYRVYGTTPEMATACAKAFCERIAEAGYTPMVYYSKYVGYLKYDLAQLSDYLSWYPEYSTNYPTFYYAMNYWQYTSSATVPGITGRADMSIRLIEK